MRVFVRGWGRDHGEKDLMDAQIDEMSATGGKYSWGHTYLEIIPRYFGSRHLKARVSAGTKLNLGGSYLLHVELSDTEIERLFYQTRGQLSHDDIARLFYQTFRHRGLDYIVRLFASFREREEAERTGAASPEPETA
jgi:hypothetical protein